MKKTIMMRLMTVVVLLSTALHALAQKELYGVQSDGGQTWTYYYDTQKESRGGTASPGDGINITSDVVKVVFDSSMADYKPKSMTGWFWNCTELTTIVGLQYLNTENVTMMNSLFFGCSSLTTLDLSTFNTSKVYTMEGMFIGCTSLKSVNLSSFDTEQVTSMEGMFTNCSSLTSLDLSSFRTAQVTNMDGMFANCENLKTIYADETRWSTAALTSTDNSMFSECMAPLTGGNGTNYWGTGYADDASYARIDKPGQPGYLTHKAGPADPAPEPYAVLSDNNTVLTFYYDGKKSKRGGMGIGPFNINSSRWGGHSADITTVVFDATMANCTSITSTACWFFNCSKLQSIIGLNYFRTDNVTNMSYMFYMCGGLTTLDVSGFKTDKVVNMSLMFDNCTGLTTLDLSNFNTSKVTDMMCMFVNCTKLTTIYVSSLWSTKSVNSSTYMFSGCSKLVGGADTKYDDNYTNVTYARIDGGKDAPGYLTDKNVSTPYAVLSDDNTVLTFYFDNKKAIRGGMSVGPFSSSYHQGQGYQPNTSWYAQRESITSIVFNPSFAYCTSITSTTYWFQDLKNLTSITGLEYLKTDNVTDMSNMFYGCQNLKNLDVSTFNTANVTNMNSMFKFCLYMQSLNVRGFNTSKVTSMNSMFYQCGWLKSLDLSSFNTESVTDMEYMFAFCGALSSLDISGFNTEKVQNMYGMFYYDESLKRLDLGSFNTKNLKYITKMFQGCSNLTTVFVSDGWTFSSVSSGNDVFTDCTKLVGGAGTTYSPSHTDYTYACIDYGGLYCGYFTDKNAPIDTMPYAVFSENNTVMTLYYDDKKNIRGGWDAGPFTWSGERWNSNYDGVVTVIFDESFSNCRSITSTACWFTNFTSLKTISGLDYLKTDNVTNMSCMFYNCSKLTALDVSNFNTSNVKDMSYMFVGCSSLTTLDLSNFKTSKVRDMSYMFYNCQSLTELDVSGFYTVKVTNMAGMFQLCSGLNTLDISRFNTSQVTNIYQLFQNCSNLKTVYVSDGWSTAVVNKGTEVFSGCTSLKGGAGTTYSSEYTDYTYASIDGGTDAPGYFTFKSAEPIPIGNPEPYALLSDNNTILTFYYDGYKERNGGMDVGPITLVGDYTNSEWNNSRSTITKVVFDKSLANCTTITSTANWFRHCYALTTIEGMENLNGCKIKDMSGMFWNCWKLANLDLSGFKTSDVTNMDLMFWRCGGLTSLDLSGFNTSNVTCMRGMFDMCSNLTSVKFGNFNTEKVTDMSEMFGDCSKLEMLDLSSFTTSQVTNISYMFQNCSALTSLNLSSFDIGNVKSCYSMFSGCTSLVTIYVDSEKWSTQSVTQSWEMFKGCTSLVGGAGTPFDANHVDATYARIDGGTDAPGYLTSGSSQTTVCAKPVISMVDGKIVLDCSTEGVTYKTSISKSFTGSSINLKDTYTLSVYAIKDGYEDSEAATIEIQLDSPDGGMKGDVTGDGEVTIKDAIGVVNMILGVPAITTK